MKALPALRVPTYGLYGEVPAAEPDFWIHAETIASRSRLHNWEIKRHRHESFFQILQIRNGDGDALLGEQRHRLTPASIVTVPPGIAHGFRFSSDLDGQVLTMLAGRVRTRSSCLPTFLASPHLLRLEAEPEAGFMIATLDRMEHELATGFPPRTGLLEACLDIVLTLAAARIDFSDDPKRAAGRDRMARLNTLIGAHYREHRPATFYADLLGISVTHLNRLCRAATGRSLGELLGDKMVDEARRNLVFSLLSIQEIAFELGYSDPAYFTRAFQRATGETPGAFRRREHTRPGIAANPDDRNA